ncbi:hypothetical protein CQZ93_14130 [Ochrobactrum vermis]|nr:hypothetical protein CQZ93_14130 [Ochrobactrum vermis]
MFKGHYFDDSVIVSHVRWYIARNLSLSNLKETMAERGLSQIVVEGSQSQTANFLLALDRFKHPRMFEKFWHSTGVNILQLPSLASRT